MKICLDFLNCHLTVAASSLFSPVTNGTKYLQRVTREMGSYTVFPSHYCVPGSRSSQKEITLGPGVKKQGTGWQWLSQWRWSPTAARQLFLDMVHLPMRSVGLKVKTNCLDPLHQPLIPCRAHKKVSINVCRMSHSMKEWLPSPYPVSSAVSHPTCQKTEQKPLIVQLYLRLTCWVRLSTFSLHNPPCPSHTHNLPKSLSYQGWQGSVRHESVWVNFLLTA